MQRCAAAVRGCARAVSQVHPPLSNASRAGHAASSLRYEPHGVPAQRLHVCARAAATQASAPADRTPTADASAEPSRWDIKMLYDGDCPLCMREVNMLRRRDDGVGKVEFVDIASPDYDPAANAGISFEQAMGEIHAILPDGRVLTNIDVFKRLYEAVGLGWVYKFAEIEPLRRAADAVYGVWARYRLPITGRPDLAAVLEQRSKKTCRSS